MALRVLLVGLVAGLGFSLPTGEQVAHWRDSAQTWVTARLAAWDAQMPAGEEAYVFVTDSALDADRVAPARVADEPTPAPAPAPAPALTATPAPTPTPAPTAATVATIATEIAAPTAITPDQPATPTTTSLVEPEWTKDLSVPTAPTAFDESEILPEIQPEPAPVPVLAAPAVALDAAFDAAMNEVVATFTADLTTPAQPAEAPALVAEAAPAAAFEPIAIEENLDLDPAYALNHAAEGLDIRCPAPDRGELITVADDLADDVAYALNREADGLTVAPAPAPRVATVQVTASELSAPSDRLTHAMRLTREAVFAWAKVLHAPAVVTISH